MLVKTISVCKVDSHILAHSNLTLPPRTLAVLSAQVEVKESPKAKPSCFLPNQYWDIVAIPTTHIISKHLNSVATFVLVNLSTEAIFLSKNKILGF